MKFTKLMFAVATLGLGVASAASSYSVKFYDSVWVGGTELKAGDYKVEVQGDKAVFKTGKSVIEVPAALAASDKKYEFTSLVSVDKKLHEIDLGGTKSKIVFSSDVQSASGSK
jgi:hypothetical protein